MDAASHVREKNEGDVQVEDASGSNSKDVADVPVHVEGEFFQGINSKTVLAFLVCTTELPQDTG